MTRPLCLLLMLAFGAGFELIASGQCATRRRAQEQDPAERLAEMTRIAHAFKFSTVDGANRTPAELIPDPLHRWTDPTRPLSGGCALGLEIRWPSGRDPGH